MIVEAGRILLALCLAILLATWFWHTLSLLALFVLEERPRGSIAGFELGLRKFPEALALGGVVTVLLLFGWFE